MRGDGGIMGKKMTIKRGRYCGHHHGPTGSQKEKTKITPKLKKISKTRGERGLGVTPGGFWIKPGSQRKLSDAADRQ